MTSDAGKPQIASPTTEATAKRNALAKLRDNARAVHEKRAKSTNSIVRKAAEIEIAAMDAQDKAAAFAKKTGERAGHAAKSRFLEPVAPRNLAPPPTGPTELALAGTPLAKAGIKVKKAADKAKDQFEVVIPRDLKAAFKRGDIKMMATKNGTTTILVVDAPNMLARGNTLRKGQIAGQATIRDSSKAARIGKAVGPAAFNAVALIVGEVQLAEINKRLAAIDKKLDRLNSNEHDKAEGRIKAHKATVLEIDHLLRAGNQVPGEAVQRLHQAQLAAAQTVSQYMGRVLRQRELLHQAETQAHGKSLDAWSAFFDDAPTWIRDIQVFMAAAQGWTEITAMLAAAKGHLADAWLSANEQVREEIDTGLEACIECLGAGGIGMDQLRFMGFNPAERMNPFGKRSKKRRGAVETLASLSTKDSARTQINIPIQGDMLIDN